MLPMALINYVGSLLWSWIHPSFDAVLFEPIPIYMMWWAVRDAKKATNAEHQQQIIEQESNESP